MLPEWELVRQWLTRAETDLRAAEADLAAQPPLTDDASFHCQQAVEKALKAFLVFRGVEFEWSHDIGYLLDLCVTQDGSFEEWRAAAAPLTGYAVRFRYPHPGPRPSPDQANEALTVAGRVCRFTLNRLPKETHPPSDGP